MTQLKHWQGALTAVFGVGLALSPTVLGYADRTEAMANAVILGVAIAAVALGAIYARRAWQAWLQMLLGLWLVASPWLLGFSEHPAAAGLAVVVGLLASGLALWRLLTDWGSASWRHDRPAH